MPCLELQELQECNARYNDQSAVTITLLSAGRADFSKWHRAGRARLAYLMQTHRQTCTACRNQA